MFKKGDLVLIIILFSLSVLGLFALHSFDNKGAAVYISINNKEYAKYSLYEDREIEINNNGYNKINIKNGKVSVEKADCRDKICVNHKEISKTSETIICLPHKLVIEIK